MWMNVALLKNSPDENYYRLKLKTVNSPLTG